MGLVKSLVFGACEKDPSIQLIYWTICLFSTKCCLGDILDIFAGLWVFHFETIDHWNQVKM